MDDSRMTFTADTYGEDFLESGELDLYEEDPENPCNIRSECALGMKEIYSILVTSGWNLRASPNVCLFCILQVGPRGELLQQGRSGYCQTSPGGKLED